MSIYWLDFVSGNDTNSGADADHGWLTPAPLAAVNAGAGPNGGDIIYGRGRYVAANDATADSSLWVKVRSGTAAAKTTFRGYDPAYPFEWWCAGLMVNSQGSLTGGSSSNWAEQATGVWECRLSGSGAGLWSGGSWLFYWNGNQGTATADQPRQLLLVSSAADCSATPDSWWYNYDTPLTIRVNINGLGAGSSVSGKILHGTKGYCLGSATNYQRLFDGLQHMIWSRFTYYNCNHRVWSITGTETGCENIELRQSGLNYCEIYNDFRNVYFKGRAANITFDRSRFVGGAYGNIYPDMNNSVASSSRGASGHVFSNAAITRCLLSDAGYTNRGQADGHNFGLQGTGRDILFAGNQCDRGTNPIVGWSRTNWFPGVGMPRVRIENNHVTRSHNSGATGAQSLTATAGNISTTSGSNKVTVTTSANNIVGVGWSVTIGTSETLNGVTLNGTFSVSERINATTFKITANQTASGTGNSVSSHAVTIAGRNAYGMLGCGWQNSDETQRIDTIAIGGITTTNGSASVRVVIPTPTPLKVGARILISTAETIATIAIAGTFLITAVESSTAFIFGAGSSANADAASTATHAITIQLHLADGDPLMDLSDRTLKGNVLDALTLLPPAEAHSDSGGPLATTSPSYGAVPYNAVGFRPAGGYEENLIEARHNIVVGWPWGVYTIGNGQIDPDPDHISVDFQYNTVAAPENFGAAEYGFMYTLKADALYNIYEVKQIDYNTYILGTGDGPRWRRGTSADTTFSAYKAGTPNVDAHSTYT